MSHSGAARERVPRGIDDFDRDSLHTLPLSMIPLQTSGLRRARMVKNSRYESVVEIFKDASAGSGQFHVDQLVTEFADIDEDDMRILRMLRELPSYDMYSLRIRLRELEIPVNDYDDLRLSQSKTRDLDDYMKHFARPLVMQVYGDDETISEFSDVIALFSQPDVSKSREKLTTLAERLGVELSTIPKFLQDYGDIYLSVSYYRQCLDQIQPLVHRLLESLDELVTHSHLRQDQEFVQFCERIRSAVKRGQEIIEQRFRIFDENTQDMWDDISAERFKQVEQLIMGSHAMLGGMLCGLSVCLDGWSEEFPTSSAGSPNRRAEYIRNDMRFAAENVRGIKALSPKFAAG